MRVEIKISDLIEHYRNHTSEIFICYHISDITKLTAPFEIATIELAVMRFFAQYFELVDGSCSTIAYWFCQFDAENHRKPESCYVMTNNGEKLIHEIEDGIETSEHSGRTLRIMLMEYILRVDPEAVFSFETFK